MKAKLRDNAPWPTQKLKTGIILNKTDFTTIEDKVVQDFIRNSLSKTVEIGGEKPVKVTKRKLKTEEPKEIKKRVLKETPKEIEKETTTKTKKVEIVDKDNLTEKELKSTLKSDIVESLLKKGFTTEELKGLKKNRLIEVYLIDKL
ncbi:MAG: hypothetical protein PF569_08235 [Candidatus Woesearchaeota archaeon]|jgi:hypothetical protein|nr:hypothetical protein [Candidatus Woesearchaeota archaeon]